jgi:hypothetical protein
MRDDGGESQRGAVLLHDLDLGVRVGREVVDRDDARLLELADVLDVLVQILEAARDRGRIRRADVRVLHAAVQLERAHRRDEHRAARREAAVAAVDVEELLGAELEREAGLGDDDVGIRERHARRGDRVRAVRDVGERTAVDERGHALRRLRQVRLDRIAQERRHRTDRLEIRRVDGRAVRAVADDDAAEPLLEIRDAVREAEDRHHLARGGDVEAGLARHALGAAPEPDDDVAQRAIVHVHHAPPQHAAARRVPEGCRGGGDCRASRRAGCARSRRHGCRR